MAKTGIQADGEGFFGGTRRTKRALAVTVTLGVFLASCGAEDSGGLSTTFGEETVVQAGVTVSDVTDHPKRYFGEEVTVTGPIRQVMGPDALMITGGSVAGEPLLVLRGDGVSGGTWEDDEKLAPEVVVRVTGTVRRFDESKIGEHLRYEPDDAPFDDYGGDATIVARKVALATARGGTS